MIHYIGRLNVIVHQARDLPNVKLVGIMDPYTRVSCNGENFTTKTYQDAGSSPVWEQTFLFNLDVKGNELFHVDVNQDNMISDEKIGRAAFDVDTIIKQYQNGKKWFPLYDPSNFQKKAGEIELSFSYSGSNEPPKPTVAPVTPVPVDIVTTTVTVTVTPIPVPIPCPAPAPIPAPTLIVHPAKQSFVDHFRSNVRTYVHQRKNAGNVAWTYEQFKNWARPTFDAIDKLVTLWQAGSRFHENGIAEQMSVLEREVAHWIQSGRGSAWSLADYQRWCYPVYDAIRKLDTIVDIPLVADFIPGTTAVSTRGHELTPYTNSKPAAYHSTVYDCDYCLARGLRFDSTCYHCDTCGNWDMCPGCIASGKGQLNVPGQRAPGQKLCAKRAHPLVFYTEKPQDYADSGIGSDGEAVDQLTAHAITAPISYSLPQQPPPSKHVAVIMIDVDADVDADAGVTSATSSPLEASNVHLLPCRIQYTGPADVDTYFHPTPITDQARLQSTLVANEETDPNAVWYDARFRGRQLTGSRVPLPVHTIGLIVEEPQQTSSTSNASPASPTSSHSDSTPVQSVNPSTSKHCHIVGTFDSFYLWQRDNEIFEREGTKQAILEWTQIAAAVHDPLDV